MMRRAILITAAGGMLALLTGSNGLRKDELRCEEAVRKLEDCCPPFEPQAVRCEYVPGCGSNPPTYPEITPEYADEIDGQSCDFIRESGECPRPIEGGE